MNDFHVDAFAIPSASVLFGDAYNDLCSFFLTPASISPKKHSTSLTKTLN